MSEETMRALRDEEVRRELLARTFVCPSCGVGVGRRCDYGVGVTGRPRPGMPSHVSRYNLAVAAGLVPPLPGVAAWMS